jgi:transposase
MKAESCPLGIAGTDRKGDFPDGISAYVQYGDGLAAFVGLMGTYGAVSDSRTSTMVRSMFGITLSPGTVVSMRERCSRAVGPEVGRIKQAVIDSDIGHFDETGARINGKLHWVHNSSTPEYTYQTVSAKRGYEGICANGVLPVFQGIAVHDCWKPYRKTELRHGLCCAHLLRELNAMEEREPEHLWPDRFRKVLLSMKFTKERQQQEGRRNLSDAALIRISEHYDRVLDPADRECPPGTKGRERALIRRLREHKDEVCMFVRDFRVPFDNNRAGRDIRNVKTKTKVSGRFRSPEHAEHCLNIISYLGACRRHGMDVFGAMTAAFNGGPGLEL